MMQGLWDMLGLSDAPLPPMGPRDDELEAAIKDAGEDDVMALARANGWKAGAPKWIWWQLVYQVNQRKKGGQ